MLRRVPRPLALLLAVSALLTVAWTFTLAPLQGPDEVAHFNYAQHLAETGHRPTVQGGDHPDSSQVLTALVLLNLDQLAGVTSARPAWSHLEERRFAEVDRQLGEKGEKDGAGPNPLAKNPPLYYAYEAVPYYVGSLGSFWDRLIVMRLSSGLLFLLTVTFAWLAAAEVFAATWPRLLTAGCVALLPEMTAMSGSINSDNLLTAIWTAFAFAALRLVRRGPSARRVTALCLLAGASLLTHGRGVAILVPLVVALAIGTVRTRRRAVWAARRLLPAVVVVGLAVVAAAVLFHFPGGAYGGELSLSTGGHGSVAGLVDTTWQFYFPRLPAMGQRLGPAYGYRQMYIEGLFGRFASLEVGYPSAVYDLIQAVVALGIAGLVATIMVRWAAIRARWREVVTALAIAVAMIALLHLASYRSLTGTPDPLITGRYLLPIAVVFALAAAFVISSLRQRTSAVLGAVLLSGMLALNLAGLMLTFTRFYA